MKQLCRKRLGRRMVAIVILLALMTPVEGTFGKLSSLVGGSSGFGSYGGDYGGGYGSSYGYNRGSNVKVIKVIVVPSNDFHGYTGHSTGFTGSYGNVYGGAVQYRPAITTAATPVTTTAPGYGYSYGANYQPITPATAYGTGYGYGYGSNYKPSNNYGYGTSYGVGGNLGFGYNTASGVWC